MTFPTEAKAREFLALAPSGAVVVPTTHGYFALTSEREAAKPPKRCSICEQQFREYPNNARPINDGKCCAYCDDYVVTPTRIELAEFQRESPGVLTQEQTAAAEALDSLYAKYGCGADGMWAFEPKASHEDLEEAYRLRAIVWRKQAPRMTAMLIRADGTEVEITPKAKKFSLEELQALVGGYIEAVPHVPGGLDADDDMICNEEGKLRGMPLNRKASMLAAQLIVGDVVILKRGKW